MNWGYIGIIGTLALIGFLVFSEQWQQKIAQIFQRPLEKTMNFLDRIFDWFDRKTSLHKPNKNKEKRFTW